VPGEVIINFGMSWNGLFLTRSGVEVNIMTTTTTTMAGAIRSLAE
jgi:hypothetical protein